MLARGGARFSFGGLYLSVLRHGRSEVRIVECCGGAAGLVWLAVISFDRCP